MKKRIKKFILISIVASEVVFLNIPPALAVHIPSASEIASDLESRYHLNTGSIQDMGEGFNVSGQKTTPPQVMLFFSPTDPKPGEKITAQALPTYFGNQKESLYYTWYLKHDTGEKAGKDGFGRKTKDGNTDYNDDGDIDIEDYKIEAMRLITNNDFDTKKANYESDSDSDGYHAIWGGDDRDKRLDGFDEDYLITGTSADDAYCYIHDFRNGENYELNTASKVNFSCSSGTARCVKNTTLTCPGTIEATGGTGGSGGSGGETPGGGSGGTGGSVSGETFLEYSVCTDLGETPACNCTESGCTPECSSGEPVCADDPTEYECDEPPNPSGAAFCSNLSRGTLTCSVDSGEPGPGTNLCRHFFPSYEEFDGDLPLDESIVVLDVNLDGEKVGDGSFGKEEEAFWKTSPQDPDTADNGNMDEANAVGLGQYQFTWNYQRSDRVGVAVEGVSMTPTKHEGSSMMIMWALPKNDCPVKNKGEYAEEIKGHMVGIPTSNMSKDDWDDCLMNNLVDPTEGGQPKKMNVSLTYSPENPMNDPTGDNTGDMIVADATIDNAAQEASQLLYKWKVEISNSFNFTGTDVDTLCDEKDGCLFNEATSTKGINIPSFWFKLNLSDKESESGTTTKYDEYDKYFTDDVAYLRVSVEASENFSSEVTREGKSNVIIKVISSDKKIDAYRVKLDDIGYPIIPSANPGDYKICLSSSDKAVCSVTANEIIGVKIDNTDKELANFSWTLNGKPLICSSKISPQQCSDAEQGSVNFFPVTGNPGETYTLTLNANDILTGKTINLVKTFQVIDPFIKINISAADADKDIVWPKYLGDYIGLDGTPFGDESDSVFQTYEGTFPVMNVEFHPNMMKNYIPPENMECEADGNSVALAGRTGDDAYNLKVPDTDQKVPGDVFNIECQALFSQPPEIRQALNNLWGISQFESTEKYLSDKVQIEVVAEGEDLSLLKPKRLMAALIQSLPSQFTFLLRIILTIIVIVITTAAVFAFIPTPEQSMQRRENE